MVTELVAANPPLIHICAYTKLYDNLICLTENSIDLKGGFK